MSNGLCCLTEFSRNMFKHAFLLLPWFAENYQDRPFLVEDAPSTWPFLTKIKKDKPEIFGTEPALNKANGAFISFLQTVRQTAKQTVKLGGRKNANQEAMAHFMEAWAEAWHHRKCFQLRGNEVKLMKYVYEIFSGSDHVHLPELLSMARLIDRETVMTARKVSIPGGWTAKNAYAEKTDALHAFMQEHFGCKKMSIEKCLDVQEKYPEAYKQYQQALRDRKHAAHLRIIEIFDEQGWFSPTSWKTVRDRLKIEHLEDFLPSTFRGRLGVQPSGYPLTFYTTSGLELEAPPLNQVVMNKNYGKMEAGKEYKIHPVEDGTFYCETTAMVGETKTKYYTMEYKRRGRKLKYETVRRLADEIDHVRTRLLTHIHSEHRDTWVRALMCLFIDATCARVGNPESARGKKKTYGVTTLLTKKHIRIKNGNIIIRYKGKHDQPQRHVFASANGDKKPGVSPHDGVLYEKLMVLINEQREHLFTRDDGKPYTPQQVNDYFKGAADDTGNGMPEGGATAPCTVHNLRNYHATKMFVDFSDGLAKRRKKITYEDLLAFYQGRTRTKTRAGKVGILEKIAKKLGNTVSICRKAYIAPKAQAYFFNRWGYRPPESLIRDVFLDEGL